MVTPLRSWIVVAASALSRRAFAVLPRRHGDAAPWLQLYASTLQLFNPGLPIRAAVLALAEASVSE